MLDALCACMETNACCCRAAAGLINIIVPFSIRYYPHRCTVLAGVPRGRRETDDFSGYPVLNHIVLDTSLDLAGGRPTGAGTEERTIGGGGTAAGRGRRKGQSSPARRAGGGFCEASPAPRPADRPAAQRPRAAGGAPCPPALPRLLASRFPARAHSDDCIGGAICWRSLSTSRPVWSKPFTDIRGSRQHVCLRMKVHALQIEGAGSGMLDRCV